MRTILTVSGVFVCFLLLMPFCATASDSWTEGKRLFEAGQFQEATGILNQAFKENPENLDISFYLGRAAFETGDYETAAMAYERILFSDPNAKRVKLELARTYLKLGSRDIARAYFKSVQATNPPPAVWQQIQQFIDTIDQAEQKHFLNGFVTMGLLYDTNVGAVPGEGNICIGGSGCLEVALDQKVEKDFGLQASAVVNHLYRFIDTPYLWKSTLTSYNNFYEDQSEFDLNYLALNTGLIRQDDASIWELQGMVGQANLDDDRYLGLLGVNLNHTRFLTRYLQLNLGLTFQDKNYYQESGRDAKTWSVIINPVLNQGPNRLSLSAAFEKEDADSGYYDYKRVAFGLRYDRQLPMDFAAYASARYRDTDYKDDEPLFQKSRSEHQWVLDVGLSKTFWRSTNRKQALAGQISYSYTDNDSNLDLYSYDKDLVLTTLTFVF